jgi:hypothetical protein
MSMTPVSPGRAFAGGVAAVLKAPAIVAAAALLTILLALPFAVVLGSRVHESLASQPPVVLEETEIDPEWWQEFRAQARGLEATFTPAIVGFAAPLDSISAVLDGRRPPLAVLGPLVLSMVLWAFLWGGALRRYAADGAIGVRGFIAAGLAFMPRFIVIALAAAVAIVVLYVTLHPLLFGPVYRSLVSEAASERTAFAVRVMLYAIFFAPVAMVGLVADYARVASVAGPAAPAAAAIGAAAAFVRRHVAAVIVLYAIGALVFATATVAYGALEIYGGSQVGGWRAIVIGQAYIVFRLALRLSAAAAAQRLFAARSTP